VVRRARLRIHLGICDDRADLTQSEVRRNVWAFFALAATCIDSFIRNTPNRPDLARVIAKVAVDVPSLSNCMPMCRLSDPISCEVERVSQGVCVVQNGILFPSRFCSSVQQGAALALNPSAR
jgi:hypothetical protein